MLKSAYFFKKTFRKLLKLSNNYVISNKCECFDNYINIFGYFDYIFSISSNARDFVDVAELITIEASLVPLRLVGKPMCEDNHLVSYYSAPSPSAKINLWFVNFDFINSCYRKNRKWFNGRCNIAIFWWEFEGYFTNTQCFEFLDEIIVFSSVTYLALQQVVQDKVKLTKLEYPFIIHQANLSQIETLAYHEIVPNKFYVLFVFDIHSYIERKNPRGVVDAFYSAWQNNKNMHLVLKITNLELWRSECRDFLSYIDGLGIRTSVTIISDNLTEQAMRDLVNACDIYISLHRAEGLGLGMLEAMSMGKPVIATRFGGNLDFMNDTNSLLVDYSIVEVQKDFASYKKGYKWAEPDVVIAAKYLLSLSQDKNLYNKISLCAKESVARQYDRVKLRQSYQKIFKEHDAS